MSCDLNFWLSRRLMTTFFMRSMSTPREKHKMRNNRYRKRGANKKACALERGNAGWRLVERCARTRECRSGARATFEGHGVARGLEQGERVREHALVVGELEQVEEGPREEGLRDLADEVVVGRLVVAQVHEELDALLRDLLVPVRLLEHDEDQRHEVLLNEQVAAALLVFGEF